MKYILVLLCASAFAGETGYVPNPLRYIRAQWYDYSVRKIALPPEYDLRKIGHGTAPVRNQGHCGSCWWFGTKGAIESLIMLRDNIDREMSGQWGIDCQPQRFSGCSGGDMAFDKFKSPNGSIYESEYPIKYQGSGRSCQTSFLSSHYHETITDWGFIKNDVESMQQAMVQNESPLAVTIGAGGMSPGSGGWQESCRTASTNHIVYVVGWLEGSLHGHAAGPYWIIQNSWGKSFGDGGFEYLKARNGSTVCASLGSEEVVLPHYKPPCEHQPKADAGEDKILVKGPGYPKEVQIGTPTSPFQTYRWYPVDGLSSSDIAQPMASPEVSTMYNIQASADCGTASSMMKVHVLKEKK